jgi:O-antigen/teichoic acid export membrane protein
MKNIADKLLNIRRLPSFLKISTALLFTQLVNVLATPFIVRLYSPSEIGTFTTFSSLLLIINTFSSLRYELGIVHAENDEDADKLFMLCMLLSIIFFFLLLMLAILFVNPLAYLAGLEKDRWLIYFLPFSALALSVSTASLQLTLRNQLFSTYSLSKIIQTLSFVFLKINFFRFGVVGLFFSQIISVFFSSLLSLRKIKINKIIVFDRILIQHIATKYIRYPKFSLGSSLLSALGISLPPIFIGVFYGTKNLGIFALAFFLVAIPINNIANPLSQTTFSRTKELVKRNLLRQTVLNLVKKLFLVACLSVLSLELVRIFIPVFMGKQWENVNDLIQPLFPYMISHIIVGPLLPSILALDKNHKDFACQALLFLFKSLPIPICCYMHVSFLSSIFIYSLSAFLGYVIVSFLVVLEMNNSSLLSPVVNRHDQ